MTGFMVNSHGANLNAICYLANGAGPHPTVVLLHGYPGNEKNLDLAQAIRRAGWNVIFFHYRGAWGSDGEFTIKHCMEDIHTVLDQIQTPDWQTRMRIDPTRVALIGHSMGAYLSVMVGQQRTDVQHVCSLAGANMVNFVKWALETDANHHALEADLSTGTALGGKTAADLVTEIGPALATYDWHTNIAGLSGKRVLLVGGALDTTVRNEDHLLPLQADLNTVENVSPDVVILDADHAFSTHRLALADIVCTWLNETT